eukprot:COSAG02_NODE_4789_length_4976_cov_3.656551_3_plen_174_part_00
MGRWICALTAALMVAGRPQPAKSCAVPSAPANGRVMVGPPCDLVEAADLVTCDKSARNLALTQPVTTSGDHDGDTAAVTDGDPSTGVSLSLPGNTRPYVTIDLQQVNMLSAVTIWHGLCAENTPVSPTVPSPGAGGWPSQAGTQQPQTCAYEDDGECDVRDHFDCLMRSHSRS